MGPHELTAFTGAWPHSPAPSDIDGFLWSQPDLGPEFYPGHTHLDLDPNALSMICDTWTDQIEDHQLLMPYTVVNDVEEEDIGIRLVHALLMCAAAIQRGEFRFAGSLIDGMRNWMLPRVNTGCGIGKVAGYFIDALTRRLYQTGPVDTGLSGLGSESYEVLYHNFYEACPYLKFAHFTANQAILEAFNNHDCVHVVDFSLMHGLQWPALIQALALRRGGPPSLRLTAINPIISTNTHDFLNETGLRLAELARSINIRFTFRVVTTSRLDDTKPWMLQTSPKEALAVNSILQLHRLLGSSIDPILEWIRNLNPTIVTLVEQEANHNQPEFLVRFTEALHYYSTMFDSLEVCRLEAVKPLAELYMKREICNILCCEGLARVERHEPLAKWRVRLSRAGFKPLKLGHNAFKQASMLVTLFSAEGYSVQESEGCLTLCWHNRPLFAASAWQVITTLDRSSSSSSSST